MFWAVEGGATTFGFPEGRKFRIEGCAEEQELDNTTVVDSEGRHCFIVVKKATLVTSPSDATPAWSHSPSTKSVSSLSSSVSTTRTSRILKSSPPRETRAPSSGVRRTAKLASSGNFTLEVTNAASRVTMSLIAPPAGTCWARSRRGSSTPTSTAPAGELEDEIVGFLCARLSLLVSFFLPPHPFVHIADDVEACALASRSTASSFATSYLPLCSLPFLSAIVLVSWTRFPLRGCVFFPSSAPIFVGSDACTCC